MKYIQFVAYDFSGLFISTTWMKPHWLSLGKFGKCLAVQIDLFG